MTVRCPWVPMSPAAPRRRTGSGTGPPDQGRDRAGTGLPDQDRTRTGPDRTRTDPRRPAPPARPQRKVYTNVPSTLVIAPCGLMSCGLGHNGQPWEREMS
ncbi:hypothetical protein GCM10018772_09710 [Streptomyces fumanus]|uniref:Uncharacterized protein n=1 Tax=Streptomyces fumanus TaxID=67302 RepID=A0A919A837_9ACTN|nr:hypothetical protein GCM10018772_09710 [Streptomyces fumanus]